MAIWKAKNIQFQRQDICRISWCSWIRNYRDQTIEYFHIWSYVYIFIYLFIYWPSTQFLYLSQAQSLWVHDGPLLHLLLKPESAAQHMDDPPYWSLWGASNLPREMAHPVCPTSHVALSNGEMDDERAYYFWTRTAGACCGCGRKIHLNTWGFDGFHWRWTPPDG